MTDLQKLTDEILIQKLERTVSHERKNTARVVAYLSEMAKRNLHLKRSYNSLYVYAREVLKYSNGSSFRRVSAAYLAIEFPKTIEAIAAGKLTLCAAAETWCTFERTKTHKSKEDPNQKSKAPHKKEKTGVFESVLGKSTDEARRELRTFEREKLGTSEPKKSRGKLMPISKTLTELRVELETENLEKFKKLQSLLSHKIPDGNPTPLVEHLIELGLEKHDPLKKEERIKKRQEKRSEKKQAQPESQNHSHVVSENEYKGTTTSTGAAETTSTGRPAIPQATQRKVKTRAEYECQYIDKKTRKKCGSTWRLSMDHVHPYSKGGKHTEENLQLLCGRHNTWKSDRVMESAEAF